MKVARFFSVTVMTTLLTLLYVYQNVEVINIGYDITRNEQQLSSSLDEHKQLVYNLNKLESPVGLSKRLFLEKIELVEADAENVYYACANYETDQDTLSPRVSMLERFLDSISVTAEARESK